MDEQPVWKLSSQPIRTESFRDGEMDQNLSGCTALLEDLSSNPSIYIEARNHL